MEPWGEEGGGGEGGGRGEREWRVMGRGGEEHVMGEMEKAVGV